MSAATASNTETLYVFLVGEGVDVWRPVDAVPLGDGRYRLPDNPDPQDEQWEFAGGSTVMAERRELADGIRLVAVAPAAPARPKEAPG
ncbi:hypothetical protein [Salinarimonas soli]|uniref:Uncharacterized protein n=1 Tax=Salinarimonas soli TaxID=1638099 RepID=A0A5B2VDU0_9HYPH|nr:hypothetical protein [Salinarimonas soli]KAA2236287.1 hypothetical protein F0L46_16420 [Salinarimonas soli]